MLNKALFSNYQLSNYLGPQFSLKHNVNRQSAGDIGNHSQNLSDLMCQILLDAPTSLWENKSLPNLHVYNVKIDGRHRTFFYRWRLLLFLHLYMDYSCREQCSAHSTWSLVSLQGLALVPLVPHFLPPFFSPC